jgi:Zn-finger nucleic acid-binding protein
MPMCPKCGESSRLRHTLLEDTLHAQGCDRCHGVWISNSAYSSWYERFGSQLHSDSQEQVAPVETRNGPALGRCPECRFILGHYRVAHDLPFTLDRCYQCFGVWLDAEEWNVLKARGLHTRLHHIFTEDWQLDVRRKANEAREEESKRLLLGDEDYSRACAVRDWIHSHPRRDLIWTIVNDRKHAHPVSSETGEHASEARADPAGNRANAR